MNIYDHARQLSISGEQLLTYSEKEQTAQLNPLPPTLINSLMALGRRELLGGIYIFFWKMSATTSFICALIKQIIARRRGCLRDRINIAAWIRAAPLG